MNIAKQDIWKQAPVFIEIWARESAAYDRRIRGALTGERLLVNFKLINTLVGYEQAFGATTHRRLGYWRAALSQAGAALPPLTDPNYLHRIDPRLRQIMTLLTWLMRTDRALDAAQVGQRILYVGFYLPWELPFNLMNTWF